MGGKKKEKKEKKGRGTKERSRDEVSEIDVHSVADSRFCNILFGTANTERTNHFSQARGGVSFRFIRVFFFFFVFCFLLFFFPPSVHRGLIIDYRSLSKTSFQLTRNAYFIFIDGCRFQSGTRHFASLLSSHPILFPFSLDSAYL